MMADSNNFEMIGLIEIGLIAMPLKSEEVIALSTELCLCIGTVGLYVKPKANGVHVTVDKKEIKQFG
jgi:hypothetical protein